jgi:hypothetical protein
VNLRDRAEAARLRPPDVDAMPMPVVVSPPIDRELAAQESDRLAQMGHLPLKPKKEDMRDAVRRAFILRGGVDELMRLEPEIFYKLFAKLIPTEISGSIELTLEQVITQAVLKEIPGDE